ncbi:PLD nuclease N-terminal domain-containing protein [Lacticaseibacillus daqingensis]|uniref:PLD nuclease N-terminal domain-containing protein n=1 Tax=Lacticaseibacillus daqingensis TaxID=2486014 RepID=UPI000F77A0ED|nr:PLD nuclease N-terminal domain-containing protein [Lacticaseibacillus daqingensis]
MINDAIRDYLPLLIPLVLAEWALAITALVSIFRQTHYRRGSRVLWVLLTLFVQPFGALAYFLIGREAA